MIRSMPYDREQGMSDHRFVSTIQHRGTFKSDFPIDVVKNEPMFFNADIDFAWEDGGKIPTAFFEALPADWRKCNPVIDSRVHMLKPGWFAAIPGFHHDDVPRTTLTGQPNYANPEYHSEHLTGLVNAEMAPTLFALGQHRLPIVESEVVYRAWHPIVEEQLLTGVLKPYSIRSGEYVQF